MDWNGDGKNDWKDDMLFYMAINADDDNDKIDPAAKWTPSGGTWVIIVIALIIISLFFN